MGAFFPLSVSGLFTCDLLFILYFCRAVVVAANRLVSTCKVGIAVWKFHHWGASFVASVLQRNVLLLEFT